MKRALQSIQAPHLMTMILFAAAAGTLAADDQFKSAADLLGKEPSQSQATPAVESGTPEATVNWIQEHQAKSANKEVEKTKRQGVKPAL